MPVGYLRLTLPECGAGDDPAVGRLRAALAMPVVFNTHLDCYRQAAAGTASRPGNKNMAENALAKKLKLKPGQRAGLIGAPEGYLKTLEPLPEGVTVAEKLSGPFDWLQVFVKDQAEIDRLGPRAVKALKPEGVLWMTFPKGTSKIQTDLTRDHGWDALRGLDLKWLTLVSVNDTWSAFALRPYRAGEARQSFR